jgi:hypothetical protein
MGAILATALFGVQFGCTREFFREWANQDVSEAVFEKTRDPRWRMDVFSVEPPALSRFADPYDQDVPPAPPDDPAAEALSPVPQWPDNRLIVPVEGTGYLDLLEYWKRDQDAKRRAAGVQVPAYEPEFWQRPDNGRHPVTDPRQPGMPGQPLTSPAGPPVPPETGSPFTEPPKPQPPAGPASAPSGPQASTARGPVSGGDDSTGLIVRLQDGGSTERPQSAQGAKADVKQPPAANSGTNAHDSTPIQLSRVATPAVKSKIPPPRPGSSFARASAGGKTGANDQTVARAAYKDDRAPDQPAANPVRGRRTEILQMAMPLQNKPPPAAPNPAQGQPAPTSPPQDRPPPALPSNILDQEIARERPPLDQRQLEEVGRMTAAEAAELSNVLVPPITLQSDTEGYGYPKGARVYKINMQQALLLAMMNARYYQFNLEQVYLAALPVTLQRFYFEPQFYAGMSPATGVPQTAGTNGFGPTFPSSPGLNTTNTFTYATRFSPSGQVSTLNLGTVAGFGKLFNSGGQLLMGFANEVMFNFLSKNPAQPTVISALPISFVQPLLRGGGRAVTLEPLTQQERSLLYAVRTFVLFRQQFFVVTLTGGTVQNFGNSFPLAGFSTPGNTDPTIGFLPVVFNLVEVEVDRRNLFFLESVAKLYNELIQGEASGLSRLQLDQVMQRVIAGRQALFVDMITYRTQLDEFKMQMGIPPDTPVIVDMSLAQPFYDVFNRVDEWQRRSNRKLDELPAIIANLPELEDIDVEGRSVLAPYRNYRSTLKEFAPSNEEGLEDTLQAAVRIALEYRMDLMNARASLYDQWRQIRVTANALRGVLNLTLTNNIYTPVAPNNPLEFLSQAKQFGLAFQTDFLWCASTSAITFAQR